MDGRKDRYAAKRAGPLCCRLPMACAEACDGWFCRQSPPRLSQCGAGAMARGQNRFLCRARCTAGNRRRSAVSGLSGGIAANRQLCLDNCGHSFYYDRRASDAQRGTGLREKHGWPPAEPIAEGQRSMTGGGAFRHGGEQSASPVWRRRKDVPLFPGKPTASPAGASERMPAAGWLCQYGAESPDRAVDRAGRGLNRIIPTYRRALPPHPEGDRRETTDASLPGLRQGSTGGSAF